MLIVPTGSTVGGSHGWLRAEEQLCPRARQGDRRTPRALVLVSTRTAASPQRMAHVPRHTGLPQTLMQEGPGTMQILQNGVEERQF